MSRMLLDEQPLQVLPCLATAIGLNEAIALQQLHWVLGNPAMGKTVDGKKYVYMSYADWRKGHFPFWSEPTIQRTFSELEKAGLVESRDDLNTLSFDRTKWYTINLFAVAAVEESFKDNKRIVEHIKMIDGHSKVKSASRQDVTTIPDTSLADASSDSSVITPSKSDGELSHRCENVMYTPKEERVSMDSIDRETRGANPKGLTSEIARALADACVEDFRLNRGKFMSAAKRLLDADKNATPDMVRQNYTGPNCWWYQTDWRGRRDNAPNIASINETWGKWKHTVVQSKPRSGKPSKIDNIRAGLELAHRMEEHGKQGTDRADTGIVTGLLPTTGSEQRGNGDSPSDVE